MKSIEPQEGIYDAPGIGEQIEIEAFLAESPEVKSSVADGGVVRWTPRDSIVVFFGDYGLPFYSYNSAPATRAMFVGNTLTVSGSTEIEGNDGEDYVYWGVYPLQTRRSQARAFRAGDGVYAYVDPVQTARAGTFDDATFVTVARSADYNKMAFYNLCGGVRFQVTGENIDIVTFQGNGGEILAGESLVRMDAEGYPYPAELCSNRTVVRLRAPEGTCFEPGVWYYIVTLPAELSQGYTMKFISSGEGMAATRRHDGSVSIKRSVFGEIADADAGLERTTYDASTDLQEDFLVEVGNVQYDGETLSASPLYHSHWLEDLFEKNNLYLQSGILASFTEVGYISFYAGISQADVPYGYYSIRENEFLRVWNRQISDPEALSHGYFLYKEADGKCVRLDDRSVNVIFSTYNEDFEYAGLMTEENIPSYITLDYDRPESLFGFVDDGEYVRAVELIDARDRVLPYPRAWGVDEESLHFVAETGSKVALEAFYLSGEHKIVEDLEGHGQLVAFDFQGKLYVTRGFNGDVAGWLASSGTSLYQIRTTPDLQFEPVYSSKDFWFYRDPLVTTDAVYCLVETYPGEGEGLFIWTEAGGQLKHVSYDGDVAKYIWPQMMHTYGHLWDIQNENGAWYLRDYNFSTDTVSIVRKLDVPALSLTEGFYFIEETKQIVWIATRAEDQALATITVDCSDGSLSLVEGRILPEKYLYSF